MTGRVFTPLHAQDRYIRRLQDDIRALKEKADLTDQELATASAAATDTDTLWKWNEEDLTQFESAIGNYTGTAAISYASALGQRWVRIALTTFTGTLIYRIKDALPARYELSWRVWGINGANTERYGVFVVGDSAPYATATGLVCGGNGADTAFDVFVLQANTVTTQLSARLLHVSNPDVSPGAFNRMLVDIAAQPVVTSPQFSLTLQSQGGTQLTGGASSYTLAAGAYDASWDGATADRAGLAVHFTGGATTGSIYFRDLRIAKHPMDR